jgi:IS5 family transposase
MMLSERGLLLKQGTIIAVPSSTKNKSDKRDPEMHQTQKGNNWHFGMRADIGVDAESGLVHTATMTAANDHDITQAHALVVKKKPSLVTQSTLVLISVMTQST